MYCSSCGVVVAQGLSYCNHCGAKLNRGDSVIKSPEVRPELLVSAMAGVFILGLAAITVLMGMMKNVLDLPVERVLALALLPFLIMLFLEGVFLRLLFRRKRGSEEAGDTVLLKGHATKELDAAHAGVLRDPMSSVTDHTTRTLEPVHNKRTSE
jgi:hypothetical protein